MRKYHQRHRQYGTQLCRAPLDVMACRKYAFERSAGNRSMRVISGSRTGRAWVPETRGETSLALVPVSPRENFTFLRAQVRFDDREEWVAPGTGIIFFWRNGLGQRILPVESSPMRQMLFFSLAAFVNILQSLTPQSCGRHG